MNMLAACAGAETSVRKLIFKSSTHFYGSEQDDPAFFHETMGRPHPPRTPIEKDILEAEASVAEFADKSPDIDVTILRFANVLGPDVRTSHIALFSLPAVPMILGFDPRYQFVHEDDVVHALEHVVQRELPGVFNVAADGVLALSEVAGLLGKTYAPILPPWGTGLAAGVMRRLGLNIPPEMLSQMRFGRGVDNRRLKAAGFEYGYTSREAALALGEHLRLHPLLRSTAEPYRYEREVEEFLRWSPNVRSARRQGAGAAAPRPRPPRRSSSYDDLGAEEILSLLGSLEPADLAALREHEAAHSAREPVLRAIDSLLARSSPGHPKRRPARRSAQARLQEAAAPWKGPVRSVHFSGRPAPGRPRTHGTKVVHLRRPRARAPDRRRGGRLPVRLRPRGPDRGGRHRRRCGRRRAHRRRGARQAPGRGGRSARAADRRCAAARSASRCPPRTPGSAPTWGGWSTPPCAPAARAT